MAGRGVKARKALATSQGRRVRAAIASASSHGVGGSPCATPVVRHAWALAHGAPGDAGGDVGAGTRSGMSSLSSLPPSSPLASLSLSLGASSCHPSGGAWW